MTPSDVFIINDNFWLQIAGTAWVQQAVAACMYATTSESPHIPYVPLECDASPFSFCQVNYLVRKKSPFFSASSLIIANRRLR
jgi:hypothetical protein